MRTLHGMGFKVGLYTDAGINGCGGINQGMYGHYQQDINTFAALGLRRGQGRLLRWRRPAPESEEPHTRRSTKRSSTTRRAARCCSTSASSPQPGQVNGYPPYGASSFASWSFAPAIANSWRTDTDVGSPAGVPWYAVVRNMQADATETKAAGPGHWNDPDYLGPNLGLSDTEFQTQFSMWAMLDAPLMVSVNLSTVSQASFNTILNKQMIAINQDPLGIQGVQLPARERLDRASRPGRRGLDQAARRRRLRGRTAQPRRLDDAQHLDNDPGDRHPEGRQLQARERLGRRDDADERRDQRDRPATPDGRVHRHPLVGRPARTH